MKHLIGEPLNAGELATFVAAVDSGSVTEGRMRWSCPSRLRPSGSPPWSSASAFGCSSVAGLA
jgi:hypothetical protein